MQGRSSEFCRRSSETWRWVVLADKEDFRAGGDMLLWLLQEEILRERSKHQRYVNKKNEELRALVQEVGTSLSI